MTILHYQISDWMFSCAKSLSRHTCCHDTAINSISQTHTFP